MAGSYEAELERAELLGVEPPDRETFERNNQLKKEVEMEEIDIEQKKELAAQAEQAQGASGKLDELNSILAKTQLKLHKFKNVCGSLTNLLKIKSDSQHSSTENLSKEKDPNLTVDDALATMDAVESNSKMSTVDQVRAAPKSVFDDKSHLDKLDSLINKAEKAEISMEHQNKQMKSFLR